MEYTAAIPEGEWISHSLGGIYTADHREADFMMVQLLADCPKISDMVVPDPFWTGHEESTFLSPNYIYYECPDYSLFPTSSDQLYSSSDSHLTLVENSVKSNGASMSTDFYGGEAKNTSPHLIEGEVDEWWNRENIGRDVEESVTYQMLQEPADSRHDICNTVSKKRSKHSENEKMNKRRRKSKKSSNDEEDDNCSSMASQMQMSGGMSSNEGAALNLNGKSRPSRGSATDAQSLYARRRREKINKRLRVLQNLVPNGTKVDINTMLEEAVNYVKFLQLQIKMLSSDDLWMYSPVCYNGMVFGLDRAESLLET